MSGFEDGGSYRVGVLSGVIPRNVKFRMPSTNFSGLNPTVVFSQRNDVLNAYRSKYVGKLAHYRQLPGQPFRPIGRDDNDQVNARLDRTAPVIP